MHVSACIFQGLFKNIVFGYVALVTKKLMGYLRFFSQTGLFSALYSTLQIKKFFLTKNLLNYYSIKVTKFHGDSVKNESARIEKHGGSTKRPPSCLGLKNLGILYIFKLL